MHQSDLPTMPQRLHQIHERLVDSGLYLGHSAFRENIRWCQMGKADRLVIQNTLRLPDTNDSPPSESASEVAVISAIAQISSNDFYLTADAGYKGPSTICPEYSSIKPLEAGPNIHEPEHKPTSNWNAHSSHELGVRCFERYTMSVVLFSSNSAW
jgi:hypothetical protein